MFAARLCPIVILLLGGILTSSTQAEEPTYLPNVDIGQVGRFFGLSAGGEDSSEQQDDNGA